MPGYLLDTNVISETRKSRADRGVIAFLTASDPNSLFLSVMTLGELRKGIAIKRRVDGAEADRLGAWADGLVTNFAGRVLPVDAAITQRWGELSALRAIPVIDTLIAATALIHKFTLVTRNVSDFQFPELPVFNPWQAGT